MPPADLNGLVRFAERRNLVSARVPSHFKSSLTKILREDYWARLQNCDKVVVSFVYPPVRSPVRMEQLGSHLTDFHEI
jgi:hypothetical protein